MVELFYLIGKNWSNWISINGMASMPILGYRLLRVIDRQMHSMTMDYAWRPSSNIAFCNAHQYPSRKRHHAPYKKCTCGFYSYHTLAQAAIASQRDWGSQDVVIVAVVATGLTFAYHEGWRTECIKVIGVLSSRLSFSKSSLQAAEHFGVPLLKQRALLRYSLEQADHHFSGSKPKSGAWILIPSHIRPGAVQVVDSLLKAVTLEVLSQLVALANPSLSLSTRQSLKKLNSFGYHVYGLNSITPEELLDWSAQEYLRVSRVLPNPVSEAPEDQALGIRRGI